MWSRFLTVAAPFFRSEVRWQAFGILALILGFIFCLGGLNVWSNFTNRDFMTAVEQREAGRSVQFALQWGGVFAMLTAVAVIKAFAEDRLRLKWREWLTRHLMQRYLACRAFHRMKARADVDNPDQRISEDVKTFTEQALALSLIFTNSTITLVLFSGILWSITPWVFLAAVLYAAFGTGMTILLGRRLVKLDVRQYRREADLRYDLIQVRVHDEPIALLGGERDEMGRLRRGLASVVENMKGVIGLSRNISFFTTGYEYLTQLVPLVIVGPLYIHGEVPFGEVMQAQMAFFLVMGAFSLIVKEFQRISTFGAVVERLGTFCEVLEEEAGPAAKSPIETVEDEGRVAFEGLTLTTPKDGRLLVKDLSVQVGRGERLLVSGPCGSGRTSLIRAAAGLWRAGQGRIVRPPLGEVMFLPQQPYLRSGTLREQVLYATGPERASDEEVLAVLRRVKLDGVLERVGGLGAEQDWPNTLSRGEQQRLAFARLLLAKPRFAFLDEATSALDADEAHHLYEALSRTPTGYVSVATDPDLLRYHDRLLELTADGGWEVSPGGVTAGVGQSSE
jgi:putative ATP-binding cassette transporter